MKKLSLLFMVLMVCDADAQFPTAHPTDAVQHTFQRYSEQFNVYIWRASGDLYAEFEPVTANPFVCSASFVIVQNNKAYTDFFLDDEFGNSLCDNITGNIVTKIYFFDLTPDISKSFLFQMTSSANLSYAQSMPVPSNTGQQTSIWDITGDGTIGLEDTIICLQILAGIK